MTAKRIYTIMVALMLCFICIHAQKDMIILRNGLDYTGQVVLVSNDKTVFKNSSGEQQEISNRSLYMIKYDKRGNVFFTETGERVSDIEAADNKIPKGSCAIYLIEGKEIIAFDVSIDVDSVSFSPSVKKSMILSTYRKGDRVTLHKHDVFLIKYQDGTKDLITDFDTLKREKAQELARQKAREEEAKKEAWLKSFPKSATIITKKEIVINAIVLSDDEKVITYKKVSLPKSPIFKMDREHIQDVFYKENK